MKTKIIDDKFYWGLETNSGMIWQGIPEYLYLTVNRYEETRLAAFAKS